MLSLGILVVAFLLSQLLNAWALAKASRAAGSARGRLRFGFLAEILLIVVSIIYTLLFNLFPVTDAVPRLLLLLILSAELGTFIFVLSRVFRLGFGRSFIPFGALLAMSLVQLGFAIGFLKPFVIAAYVLPSKSMMPTIDPGGRFVVNKLIQPRRLDLVAYWNQGREKSVFCKRLVGLPGDRLRFDQGTIFINDQPMTLPPVIAGKCHAFLGPTPTADALYKDGETIVLGNNDYFFVGDNIDISADSRIYGPSDRSALVGVVDLIYWPIDKARVVWR